MRKDCQKGNPVHHPTITSPGSTKMIAESVPAADATVWTMLFSRMDESLKTLRTAIEITAAGMDDATVRPTLSPRYTLAAVNAIVMRAPRNRPRKVSSFGRMAGNSTAVRRVWRVGGWRDGGMGRDGGTV